MGGEGKGFMGGGSDRDEAPEGGKPACTVPVLVWLATSWVGEGYSLPCGEDMERAFDLYVRFSGGVCPGLVVREDFSEFFRGFLPQDRKESFGSDGPDPSTAFFFMPRPRFDDEERIDAVTRALAREFSDRGILPCEVRMFRFSPDFKTYEVVEIPKDDPGSPA